MDIGLSKLTLIQVYLSVPIYQYPSMSSIFKDQLSLSQEESLGLHPQHLSDIERPCEAIIQYPEITFVYLRPEVQSISATRPLWLAMV